MQELVASQKSIEVEFEREKSSVFGDGDSVRNSVKQSTQSFSRAVKQTPLSADNVEKMQADRFEVQLVSPLYPSSHIY